MSAPRPAVWPWYRAYCGLLAFAYVGVIAAGVWLFAMVPGGDIPLGAALLWGLPLTLVGGALLIGYATLPWLPRRPWAWTLHLVVLIIGVVGACPPLALPLLFLWLRDDVKRFFGRIP